MITFRPMTPLEYDRYLDISIVDYAEDKGKAGNWLAEEALSRSKAEFDSLLPQGLQTPQHLFFSLLSSDVAEPVGMIWVHRTANRLQTNWFIYDFIVDEPYRRRGYGRETLQELARRAEAEGIAEIRLHVFAHNQGALALYEQVGFEPTNINMTLKIGSATR